VMPIVVGNIKSFLTLLTGGFVFQIGNKTFVIVKRNTLILKLI
jgi:hypothetical protein